MAFAAPQLRTTAYDGALQVNAQWKAVEGAASYTLKVYEGNRVLESAVVRATVGSVTLKAPITSRTAQVAVAAGEGSGAGPDSIRMLVVVDRASGLKAACDGSQVHASWTLPQGSVANLGQVRVLSAGGRSLAQQTFEGTEGTLTPTPPASGWATLEVRAAVGGSLGPVATLPLVTAAAAARAVSYDPAAAKRVEVVLASPVPLGCSAAATLYANGVPFASEKGLGAQVMIPLASALDPATEWTVRPRWVSGGASGPSGEPVALMVVPPSLLSIAGDGSLAVAWENQPGQPFPTRGQLRLSAEGGALTSAAVIQGGDGGLATPLPALKEGKVYSATVAGLRGPAKGPPSEPVPVPYVKTPIALAAYDGETLTVTWAEADPAETTGCRIELLKGDVQVGEFPGTGKEASALVALDPAATYQVRLRWLAGRGSGPAGTSTPVVSAAPVLERAEVLTGAEEVELTWTGPAGAVPGYVAVFRCEGAPDEPVSLAAGATSPAKVALPAVAALTDPLGRVTVALRATRTGAEGPPSEALPLVVSAPALEAVEYDGTRVSVSAAPVPSPVDGYETRASWDAKAVASPGPSVSFPASPSPTAPAKVEIVARRGAGLGPSEVAGGTQLVLGAPEIGARGFDGTLLTVAVTPSTAPAGTPSGYLVELLRGDVVVERAELPVPAAGDPLDLPVGRVEEPTAAHAVRVRTRSGISLGPAAEAPVTLAAPSIASVSVGTEIEAELLAGSLTAAGLAMEARLVVDGTPGTPVAADPQGKVEFALPASGSSWAIATRATYDGVTGPWSEPVTVPSAVPASLAADYSNGRLRASWAGDSEAVYLARVLAGDVELARARVRGTEAELRFAPPTDGAMAELSVREVAGVATGPVETLALVTASRAASAVTSQDQSTVTVSWDATKFEPTPTDFVPVVSWEGETRELPEVPVKVSSASVPLAGVPAGAVVGVRVKAEAALGPLGETATVVFGRPTDLSLDWEEEGELVVSWVPPELSWDEAAVLEKTVGADTTKVADLQGSRYRLPLSAASEGTTLAVAATAAGGTGATTSAPVLFEAPLVTAMAWDGRALTLSWKMGGKSAAAGAYLVTVSDRGRVVAERTVTASAATLAVSELSDEATVSVAALASSADWPRWRSAGPAAKLAVPVAAPAVSAVVIDPVSGTATVSWSEVAGATSYELQAYLDGVPEGDPVSVKAPEKSAQLTKPPAAGQDLAVAVRAVVATSEMTCTGPPGSRVAVLTAAPEITAVDFDGVSATVSWLPLAGASGYAVAIFGKPGKVLATASAPAGATSLRLALPPWAPGQYQVAVQAQRGSSTGVAATAALFQPGLYPRASARGPAILRTASERLEAEAVTVYLPPLGEATLGPLPIEPAQAGESKPPFKLAANTDSASKATLPYVLTIGAGALSFEPTRSGLQDTYRALLVDAEQAGAGPQGIFALQQAISRLMPQTFAETLYYAYGLSPLRLYVDLRPGMILRVAAPGFDLTAVDSVPPPAGWATGYAPGGAIDLAIDDYLSGEADPQWRVGFDAFLATLAASGALEVPAPKTPVPPAPSPSPVDVVETGGADAADLFFEEFRNPYYRLLIPAAVQAASQPTTVRTSQQFAIASAPRWEQIDARPPESAVKVAYFRGRAVLRPCIRVEVEGRERVVPVGTTVGNLLDGLGRRPPSTARPLVGLRLERALGPAVLDPTAPYDAGASARVNLDWLGLVTMAPGVDALSLPLLHGDRLSLGEGG